MIWNFILNSYLKNEKNKLNDFFNCFICMEQKQKNEINEVEIGNINKSFYVCSEKCNQQFLSKEIIKRIIYFENLSEQEKNTMIKEHLEPEIT